MWRKSSWEEGHYIDEHEKYECMDCDKEFIVGAKLLKSCEPGYPICPYCGSKYIEWIVGSGTDDDMMEELADTMGCLGIYVDEE